MIDKLITLKKQTKNSHSIHIGEKYCGAVNKTKSGKLIVVFRGTPNEINQIIRSEILYLV